MILWGWLSLCSFYKLSTTKSCLRTARGRRVGARELELPWRCYGEKGPLRSLSEVHLISPTLFRTKRGVNATVLEALQAPSALFLWPLTQGVRDSDLLKSKELSSGALRGFRPQLREGPRTWLCTHETVGGANKGAIIAMSRSQAAARKQRSV